MDRLETCVSAESDNIETEISFSVEDETCEGGVLETEEEEELGESLKNAINDQSVKPKVNYIMSSSSFSMLTVQSEDSGIIWETVSSSRCSTPWASESTASDVYSVESASVNAPPGKVIFIMDELPESPFVNGRHSSKMSKSEKRRHEKTDLKPGELKDALKKPRNNSCALRTQPEKSEPNAPLNTSIDKMAKSKPLQDSYETETDLQLLMEHSPVVSKVAEGPNKYRNDVSEVLSSVQDSVQQHGPVHCQKKFITVEQNEQNILLTNPSLNTPFSTDEQQISASPVQPRKEEELETNATHVLEQRIDTSLPENKEDSRLSTTISLELVPVSELGESCTDAENLHSVIKQITSNGAVQAHTDNLKTTADVGSDQSSPEGKCIWDFKSLAFDMDPTPVPLKDNSYVNESPAGKMFAKAVTSCFPAIQEIVVNQDQSYSMADPTAPNSSSSVNSSSEFTNPVGSLQPVTSKDEDNSILAMEDKGIETIDFNLKNLSCSPPDRTFVDTISPYCQESQDATINENMFSPRGYPEQSEVIQLNGSLLRTTCRTAKDKSQSQLIELEKVVDELNHKEDTEIQKAIFNIVAEGSEILNIVAPAQVYSVDQEACHEMQDNLIYLQTNPIEQRKNGFSGSCFNREVHEQQLRLMDASEHCELEQTENLSNSWSSNPFSGGKCNPFTVIHSNHSHNVGSNPTHEVESNPGTIGSNPSHTIKSKPLNIIRPNPSHTSKPNPSNPIESNPSHTFKSNPSDTIESNPSRAFKSNPSDTIGSDPSNAVECNTSQGVRTNPSHTGGSSPSTTEASNPSIIDFNPSSVEQPSAVCASVSKVGNGDDDYFEKYTLVDEQVPVDLDVTELKFEKIALPEADNTPASKLKSTSFPEDVEVFDFDEFDLSGNPGTFDGMTRKYETPELSGQITTSEPCNERKQEDINKNITDVLNQKEAGSLLFSTDEGVLSRSYNFPISTKLIDLALLEEPPALAFYYKDLYEEAKGRKGQNNEQSDEDSSNPELSFPCQSSDTDDGNGLYFEKYVLRDDILESSKEPPAEESPYRLETVSQNDAIDSEDILFSESEHHIPEIIIDSAKVPTQKSDSEEKMEVQEKAEDKSETGENAGEESSILSEFQSVKYVEVSGERGKPIELVEEDINELMSEEVQASRAAPFKETLYLEDIEKPASNVEDHLDTGQLANAGDSFEEYGKPPGDAGLEDVSNTLASVEVKDSQGGEFNEETSVYQLKAKKSEQGQSAEQERSEYRIEGEYHAPEIGQEAKSGGSGESIKADDKVCDQINNNEIILEMDKIAPQIVIEEYGKVDHSVEMKQEIYEGVLKATPVFIDQKLPLGLTKGSGVNDEMELRDIETQQAAECMGKEEIVPESQNQEMTTNKANSQIVNDQTIPGPDLFEGILDSAEEVQEEGCFAGDIVQPFQSECGLSEAATHETPTDIIMHEQDSRLCSTDSQTEYKLEIEQDSHKTVSESEDNEKEAPQLHYPQEIVPSLVDNIEMHLHQNSENLFVKDIRESSDLSLLENVTIAKQDTEFEICGRGQNIEDKEFHDLTQEKVEDTHVKAEIGEEGLDVLISQKPAKLTDTFCVTCGLSIFAIDKLFGEHQDHDVIAIDTAVLRIKEKLDDCVQAAEERTKRTEEFVIELEDVFNAVEENCTKEEKFLEEQHEEVMNLLLSQYTELSQVLEEEKKVKLDHLYEQMAHYRRNIDSAKETIAMTKKCFQLDDMAFLKSFRMINDSVIDALESAISMDLKPSWCSPFEDLAVKSTRPGFESLKNLPGSITEEYKMAVKESYCTLDNLEPNRCYVVWVMAVNFAGCSLPSEKVTVRTLPAAPVINTEECTVCWDTATIRWTSADLEAVEYFILEFHRQSDVKKSTFRSMAGLRVCEHTVTLQPLENFLFFVKAVNSLGTSDTSKPAVISTKNTHFRLNKETLPPHLQLSEDGTVIHFDELGVESENLLPECPAVLGELLPARGRHYWEATVDRCEAYRIGVTYPPTTRNSSLGRNRKSWFIRYFVTPKGHRYEFLQNGASYDVLITDFPARIGVFVNCDMGQLSFFNAQSGQLLHAFQHHFTDFICPAFVVERPGFLTVCTGVELPEFAKCS
ncbi:cardiomyopathy-associated protein 5-like isoform X2 [Stegostoma tigrinum]|uniref:cardiomyopathy-associated protein 5-like isoform X2 n=1 Tax=Stegostoma tigrinum TaxID=3053191 RepID=UPI00202B457E|nr:cardiomyopathy-associated protein 5-like isoform X2 [Stegostoma tigrinum]